MEYGSERGLKKKEETENLGGMERQKWVEECKRGNIPKKEEKGKWTNYEEGGGVCT